MHENTVPKSLVLIAVLAGAGSPVRGQDAPSEETIAYFEQNIEAAPEGRDSADHYIAMALAGRARVALEHAEWERATADVPARD